MTKYRTRFLGERYIYLLTTCITEMLDVTGKLEASLSPFQENSSGTLFYSNQNTKQSTRVEVNIKAYSSKKTQNTALHECREIKISVIYMCVTTKAQFFTKCKVLRKYLLKFLIRHFIIFKHYCNKSCPALCCRLCFHFQTLDTRNFTSMKY